MRRVLLTVLGVVPTLLLSWWFVLGRQAQLLGEGLVRDASALEARRFEQEGAPGELMACLGNAADVSPDLSRTLPWVAPEVLAATNGSGPLAPRLLGALVDHRAWLEQALACGRLRLVAPSAGLGPFADVRHGRRQTMPRLMESLSTLAPLSMRAALVHGAPEEALETCASVLALTTAWLRLEGLESMLPTLGPSRAVLPACEDAARQADQRALGRFHARLAQVRALAPGYAEVMALERTQLGLRLFGGWLPPELDGQLPPSARLVARTQRDTKFDRGVLATLALRLYWKRYDAGMRELERAATLAPVARQAGLVAAQRRLEAPLLRRFLAADPVDLKYEMYAAYLDQLHAVLDALAR